LTAYREIDCGLTPLGNWGRRGYAEYLAGYR